MLEFRFGMYTPSNMFNKVINILFAPDETCNSDKQRSRHLNRKTCFLVMITTTVFLLLYGYRRPMRRHFERFNRNPFFTNDAPKPEEVYFGFAVHSSNCKIPDFNPFHPSIIHLVETKPPINCSDNFPLTTADGNLLTINMDAAHFRRIGNFSCCYRTLFRTEDGKTDNSYKYSKTCREIIGSTEIKKEFIAVECKLDNGTIIYKDYHSFIHDKPQVEKRCENSKKANFSVLVVGIDAVSRLNMHRQFKKTSAYLLEKMQAMEMYGYNKVGDNTFPNLIPMLVGYDERELTDVCWNSSAEEHLDKCDFIWKHFKEHGYRTLYAEDSPSISSFNYCKLGFAFQPTDYYFRTFIQAYEKELGNQLDGNCYLCVGTISETEAVLRWLHKFLRHFQGRPYFAFSWINSLTHDYLNMGSSGDHLYENFFRTLHSSGTLDDTIVIVMADHGLRWGSITETYVGQLESRLPMLLISLPEKFKQQYPDHAKHLSMNRHRLVTPFDLFATLHHLLVLDKEWVSLDAIPSVPQHFKEVVLNRSISLFTEVPEDRSCSDANIDEHWCTCDLSLEANLTSTEVLHGAAFLIEQLNDILKIHSKICAFLKLDSIKQARMHHPLHADLKHTNVYTVEIQTVPGNALFEGTVLIYEKNAELLGTISRLNLYGNQSSCVSDAALHKYCYCKQQ